MERPQVICLYGLSYTATMAQLDGLVNLIGQLSYCEIRTDTETVDEIPYIVHSGTAYIMMQDRAQQERFVEMVNDGVLIMPGDLRLKAKVWNCPRKFEEITEIVRLERQYLETLTVREADEYRQQRIIFRAICDDFLIRERRAWVQAKARLAERQRQRQAMRDECEDEEANQDREEPVVGGIRNAPPGQPVDEDEAPPSRDPVGGIPHAPPCQSGNEEVAPQDRQDPVGGIPPAPPGLFWDEVIALPGSSDEEEEDIDSGLRVDELENPDWYCDGDYVTDFAIKCSCFIDGLIEESRGELDDLTQRCVQITSLKWELLSNRMEKERAHLEEQSKSPSSSILSYPSFVKKQSTIPLVDESFDEAAKEIRVAIQKEFNEELAVYKEGEMSE